MIRLFVGLDLPPDLAERLTASNGGVPGARWIEPRNLHLTLRFAGEIDETSAEDLHDALCRVEQAPFTLTLGGLGLFGSRRRAHALWRGIERSEALDLLARRVEAASIRAGLPPEPRRFVPHITLARLSAGATPERVQRWLETLPPPETLAVDRFTLFQSRLGQGGAEYDRLTTYALGTGNAVRGGLSDADAFG
ncbi:RNA 2',3'-cyclic phosphodiesterase [Magnetospirillum fulvum]|uniref:RNA 2',3'-cyclic phosphodiesterase n=1 Tax=Magnetospirillum fulvum TaxID=1082 RepID=A0A1H6J0Z0_MAGFU|nr:RNA 2',3'-cyclic phosphodiesterase [Magnetospirillum fulvum]SEH52435.1 2'-5' RNA ligase [Magnetospirillum fulvum]